MWTIPYWWGCGRLGSTLLAYDGFKSYGFNIVAGFDINPTLTGSVLSGKPVFPLDQLSHILQRLKIQIGIIYRTQAVCPTGSRSFDTGWY
jgi:redox-sensing transcriptional repressor